MCATRPPITWNELLTREKQRKKSKGRKAKETIRKTKEAKRQNAKEDKHERKKEMHKGKFRKNTDSENKWSHVTEMI
jgi:hypothetical protein